MSYAYVSATSALRFLRRRILNIFQKFTLYKCRPIKLNDLDKSRIKFYTNTTIRSSMRCIFRFSPILFLFYYLRKLPTFTDQLELFNISRGFFFVVFHHRRFTYSRLFNIAYRSICSSLLVQNLNHVSILKDNVVFIQI